MKLDIIYEDKDILVCFKPAGVATQTARLSSQDVVSMMKNYLAKQTGEKDPYVGVIHRLDQPVSGLLVFAKNQKSAASLSRQIQDGNANKDYIAMCLGTWKEKSGQLIHYIRKDPVTKLAKVLDEDDGSGFYKKAVLTYEVEKELDGASIVKVHLQTGRFHQIRAQFSHMEHALLGDAKYADTKAKEESMKRRIPKIALVANRLVLKHPATGEEMEFVLTKEYLPQWYR